jgi:inner membrane protein YidH
MQREVVMDEGTKRDEGLILAQERTDLAAERNLLAADRTLLAWIRTAVSLLAFGFGIYRLMDALHKSGKVVLFRPQEPRNLGFTLIATGTFSLLAATITYWKYVKVLGFHNRHESSKVTIVGALLVVLIGILILVSILANVAVF